MSSSFLNRPVLIVVAGVLVDKRGRLLLAKRPKGKPMAGLWEFPGGKMEAGETPEAALARELHEELSIAVEPEDMDPFSFASHTYEGFHLLMPVFMLHKWAGEPEPREGQELDWVSPDRLGDYPTPPADFLLFAKLQARMARP
jgi:8-oxo-dGTP diphosphatase